MAFIGKLGRSRDAAVNYVAPPELEQVVEGLLRNRISRLKIPPDIKPLFRHRMRTNMRKTTAAWCVWVGLLILINSVFDPFMVPRHVISLIIAFRLTLTASLLAAGLFVRREILTSFSPVYLGLPCILAVLFAGLGGLATHDTGVLTRYLDNAMIVDCTAIIFIGIELNFCLGICATCLPLIAFFLGISPLQTAARLQIIFFDVTAFLSITYGRHVQNLILSRLFLLNMRDELRDSAARARNAQLSSIAYTDPLTEIPNRRYFDEIAAMMAENPAKIMPVAVCMIDIDHFKTLNDKLGHLQGDRCLKLVAATIRNNLRSPSDIVARFGGEEFVLLFQNTDLHAAYEVAERVRGAIIDLQHPNPDAPGGIVTVSAGVAELQSAPLVMQTLVGNADHALYRAKLTGRNRVST